MRTIVGTFSGKEVTTKDIEEYKKWFITNKLNLYPFTPEKYWDRLGYTESDIADMVVDDIEYVDWKNKKKGDR